MFGQYCQIIANKLLTTVAIHYKITVIKQQIHIKTRRKLL